MSIFLVLSVIIGYFGVLLIIEHFTSRKSTHHTFFTADRKSPWYLVAFGMIGASLSGITFVSVPGGVTSSQFSYMQMVLGYLLGYLLISAFLLPLYYRLNVVSIYEYLGSRFGFWSHKIGASFFLLSRIMGASARLYLMASILQMFIFHELNVSFEFTVAITLILIWIYTFRGGIKTIVWTDALQTTFMLLAAILTLIFIAHRLNWSLLEVPNQIIAHRYTKVFFFGDMTHRYFFWKSFFSGTFITLVMSGLDQDIMQKNLTCRTLFDARKNMFWFSISLIFVNLLFLSLGILLVVYAEQNHIPIPKNGDNLYPLLAKNDLGIPIGILFLLGVVAAAYSSADSALTSLTTSFCTDILNFEHKAHNRYQHSNTRFWVHIGMTVILFFVILGFRFFMQESAIHTVFKVAGFTYGPLLGLYAFGLLTKIRVEDRFVPVICIISPVFSYILDYNSEIWFNGFTFDFTILIVNGMITFIGLAFIQRN